MASVPTLGTLTANAPTRKRTCLADQDKLVNVPQQTYIETSDSPPPHGCLRPATENCLYNLIPHVQQLRRQV